MQTRLIPNQKFYAKPFLKWVGGKRQLLNEITNRLPNEIKNTKIIPTYIEPFLGGGSVFFHLKNKFNVEKSIISDINPELMLTYKCIQTHPEDMKEFLNYMQKTYNEKSTFEEKKEYYHTIRQSFNRNLHGINIDKINEDEIKRAAQTIFMNKTCFNGLFRVNKKGEFNVPIGRYKNPTIYDPDNIDEVHYALNDNVIIKVQNYLDIEKNINSDSFVYLDPPYRPISKTSSFTGYYKDGFDEEDQINLCELIQRLNQKNINTMLSNSQTDDGFFEKKYSKQYKYSVKANRSINSNGKKRNKVNELIITTYNPYSTH